MQIVICQRKKAWGRAMLLQVAPAALQLRSFVPRGTAARKQATLRELEARRRITAARRYRGGRQQFVRACARARARARVCVCVCVCVCVFMRRVRVSSCVWYNSVHANLLLSLQHTRTHTHTHTHTP